MGRFLDRLAAIKREEVPRTYHDQPNCFTCGHKAVWHIHKGQHFRATPGFSCEYGVNPPGEKVYTFADPPCTCDSYNPDGTLKLAAVKKRDLNLESPCLDCGHTYEWHGGTLPIYWQGRQVGVSEPRDCYMPGGCECKVFNDGSLKMAATAP